MLAALEQAAAALAAARTGLSGPLRIGAFPTAVRTLLPAALVALGPRAPGPGADRRRARPGAVPAALRDGALDVALVHDYDVVPIDPDPALDTAPLLDETMYLAATRTAWTLAACRDGRGSSPGPARSATP